MANYVESFTGKMDWAKPFQRTGKFPLDRSDLFSSYEDAVKYAAGNKEDPDSRGLCGTSYVGQIISVYENDVVTVYKINADRTLGSIGSASVSVDGKSLVSVEGVLGLKGFAEVIAAGNFAGKQPRINANGEIEWYTPDTSSVSGLQETVGALKDAIDGTEETPGLVQRVTDLESGKVDKEEGKGLSTNDYTSEDKAKVAGIAAGAQVNVLEKVKVNGTEQTIAADKSVDIKIPVSISELTNDENFIDNTVSNLTNYYLKTETYTRDEITELLGQISTMNILKVDSLPTEDISSKTIYLVPKADSSEDDVYEEYIYVEAISDWERIGNTQIDLSNYLQKTGDASKVTVTFTPAEERVAPVSGEALDVIFGKLAKYLADLKTVAFTGSYRDLVDRPTQEVKFTAGVLTAGDTQVAIRYEGTYCGTAITDSATGEQLMADIEVTVSDVTITLAEAYSNNLNIVVTSYVS